MEQEKILQLKEKLEKEQKSLREELNKIATEDPNLACNWDTKFPDIGRGEDDNASEVELYDRTLPLEQNLELRFCAITEALKKINNNPESFGICEKCGQSINIKRLEITPEAKTCVECEDSK